MYRVWLIWLLILSLFAGSCNKAGEQKDGGNVADARGAAALPAEGTAPLMASAEGDEGPRAIELTASGEANQEYTRIVLEIAPEYGIRYEEEKNLLYNERGDSLGTPEDIAGRVNLLLGTDVEPAIQEPTEAVRFLLEGLAQPDIQPAEQTPPQPQEAAEPVEEKADLSGLNSEEMLIELASEYGLTYDNSTKSLNGPGFPAGGIGVGTAVSKVNVNLEQRGADGPQEREAEVRTVLNQLAEIGKQRAQQQPPSAEADTEAASSAQSGRGRKPLNYYPETSEFIHPQEVVGDWKSIREDHPSFEVKHDDDYFSEAQLRYRGNAVFRLHKNGEMFSDTEFPYRYDPRNGVLTLLGPDGKAEQTYTVWATERDPLLIWLQRENSKVKTLYEKVGRGGEPTTLDEEVEGVRLMLGDEEAEAYRKREEAKGRR